MLTFRSVPEKTYYVPQVFKKKLENVMYVDNRYILSYYISDGIVYAYYQGKYMKARISANTVMEEIDLINLIISESKRLKVVEEEEIEID